MLNTIMLVLAATTAAEAHATAADVGRCIQSSAETLSKSGDAAPLVAEKVVASCGELITQYSAARDAMVAREAGPVPAANSAEWRNSVTASFRRSALLAVERARRTH